jgi:tetratricopeptide (TPR) repeat protein/predicted Ser/Thr protein kinase
LEQHPELWTTPDAILDLLQHEVSLCQECGDGPRLADFVQRFKQFESQLEQFFQNPQTRVLSNPLPPSTDRSVVPVIPGYEILGELGRGGMGVVYKARQCSLDRLVALKMILVGADKAVRVRFRTEAEAVARLQHPSIVQIHEIGEHDGTPFLSLEYVDGGNLQEKVAHTAQPEREAALLVETLARAMHHTHLCGILHRDLKPNNILLTADGTPKITDFGLAKFLDRGDGPTRADALIGTPNYMPPEQAAGDVKKIGVPADVYSLGAILYELLTGRAPFKGTTLLNTLEQVRTQEPVSPRRLRGPVSRDLEMICLKCLEKDPTDRYASAEALANDLQRYLDGRSISARPQPLWQHMWRGARRRPGVAACVLAAAALICLALVSASYFRATGQLGRHHVEENYQLFVKHRDEALFFGLLNSDEGAPFLGADPAACSKSAASAARNALALAGISLDSDATSAWSLPMERKAAIDADCYTLLLIMAGVTERKAGTGGDVTVSQEPLRLLERARQFGFDSRAYRLRKADFLEQAGNAAEASHEREYAARMAEDNALDRFLTGQEEYRHGNWPAAKNAFSRALHLQPDHFWARFFLAVCHLKTRHWEAAKTGLSACLAQQPHFVWAYLFRSFANEKLRSLPEAEADFEKALALNPGEDARYVLLLTRGILHFNQQELERAAADFRSALALRPNQYNAYLNLAQVLLAQRRFDEAENLVGQAMKLQPPDEVLVGYHIERGRNLLGDQRFEEALHASAAALELAPRQPIAHGIRARALLALSRFPEAEAAFDDYLQHGGQAIVDIFLGRGTARMKLGKYPEAAEDYTRALERGPDRDLYEHRGWAHFFSDAWRLAERDFSQALALDATHGDAYTGRGLARVMLGNYRDGVKDAEHALSPAPGTPEMMHNTACIFSLASARASKNGQENDHRAWVGRAIETVYKTLEMLPAEARNSFWRNKILVDPALMSLYDEPGFQSLRREYDPPGG